MKDWGFLVVFVASQVFFFLAMYHKHKAYKFKKALEVIAADSSISAAHKALIAQNALSDS
jgi:hypothetical protein